MIKRLRLAVVIFGIAVVASASAWLIWLWASGGAPSSDERHVIDNLVRQLKSGKDRIPLMDINEQGWSRVCAFPPYLDKKTVEDAFRRPFAEYGNHHWFENDGYKTLIFSSNDGMTAIRIQRVLVGDLEVPYGTPFVCAGRTGQFVVSREPVGKTELTILKLVEK